MVNILVVFWTIIAKLWITTIRCDDLIRSPRYSIETLTLVSKADHHSVV